MFSRSLFLSTASLLATGLLGCSSADVAATPSASSTGGSAFEFGGVVTTYETGIGPVAVMPGEEHTECITIRLKNPEIAFIRRFNAQLGGSHHMIVYRSTETTEAPTPVPCQGFSGILEGDDPIFIAQQADATLEFPMDGENLVGLQIAPNQMVRIEMHYINPQNVPITVNGKATMDTIPPADNITQSDIAFWGTTALNGGGAPPSMDIPANGTGDTGVKFQLGVAGTKSFAVTTHEHHLGTRMRIWYGADGNAALGTAIADSTSWSDPPLVKLDPPIEFPENDGAMKSTQGLAYECQYNNPTPASVTFGESVNNEMCFLWHYYYPAKGLNICLDGLCK